jgi:hypothetical protein
MKSIGCVIALALSLCVGKPAPAQQVPEPYTSHFRVALRYLYHSLRDPHSLELIHVSGVHISHAVCIVYRAKNGFGGFAVEHFAYRPSSNEVLTDSDTAFKEDWHLFCELHKSDDITPQAKAELADFAGQ